MSTLLLLTSALQPSAEVLPGLALLGHQVKILPAEGSALLEAPDSDLILVDGRQELAHARDLCRLIRTTGRTSPVVLIVTEGGLSVLNLDWGMDDVVLHTCGPAELEARIKLAIGRLTVQREADDPESHVIRTGEVVVDDATYTAKVSGRPLDLTFKEFELLKFLAQHPGRVFSRQQLLQEVWGYDYFGGTRTVDVHVRRLRAKLGPENETLIGTVRNVGYRFVLPAKDKGKASRHGSGTEARADGGTAPTSRRSRTPERPPPGPDPRHRRGGRGGRRGRAPRRGHLAGAAAPPRRVRAQVTDHGFTLLIGDELSLVVTPDQRGRGYGGALAAAALEGRGVAEPPGPTATTRRRGALAQRHGFERVRELWVMRRPPRPAPRRRGSGRGHAPRLRAGDEAELLRVNAAAFADHPEQGGMDAAEPRRADGRAVVRPRRPDRGDAGRPDARLPLDQAALRRARRGLRRGDRPARPGRRARQGADPRRTGHLASRGVREVLLYVESDNTPAIAVYSGLGFTHARPTPT